MSVKRIKDKRMVAFANSRFSWKHQVVVVFWRLENTVVTFIELHLLHLETDTKLREENSALDCWISVFVCLVVVVFQIKMPWARFRSPPCCKGQWPTLRSYFCPVSGTPCAHPCVLQHPLLCAVYRVTRLEKKAVSCLYLSPFKEAVRGGLDAL